MYTSFSDTIITQEDNPDVISIVDNIFNLTTRQIDLFFMKLWKKYSSVIKIIKI